MTLYGTCNNIDKAKKTNLKKYGIEYCLKNKEIHRKTLIFGISKPEKEILELLRLKFEKVEREYKSEKYPFRCDFYIHELDLYVEYQGHWTHSPHPFKKNKENFLILKEWKKKKAKGSAMYNRAVYVWTISDVKKRETACKNGLNWIEFFNMKEFKDWYDTV